MSEQHAGEFMEIVSQRDALLAACKVALEYLAPVCISSQGVPNMLRAAIAKAEGSDTVDSGYCHSGYCH